MRAPLALALLAEPGSQGNDQILSDGNSFVGWGEEPYFTEFNLDPSIEGPLRATQIATVSWRFIGVVITWVGGAGCT